MQKETNNRLMINIHRISRVCCAVFSIFAVSSPNVFAQGMGGGMMGMGMGQGMQGNSHPPQTNNAPPPPPKHQNPFSIDAAPAEGLEARTTALENFIFGSVQKKLPIEKRVERLEKKLIPYEHHKSNEDLNQRIDHLWTILSSANKSSEKTTQ